MASLISVAVPVYKTEGSLYDCLLSIYQQEGVSIEIVVVNDGSDRDKVETICASLPTNAQINVRIIHHSRNLGLLASRLTAIESATGDYLLHLDSDDSLEINVLSNLVKYAQRNSAACLLFSINEHCDGNVNVKKFPIARDALVTNKTEVLDAIRSSLAVEWLWHVSWNKLWKRGRLVQILSEFQVPGHIVMYEDLLLTLFSFIQLNQDEIVILDNSTPIVNYYRNPLSVTRGQPTRASITKNCLDTLKVVEFLRKTEGQTDSSSFNVEKMYESMINKNFPPVWLLKKYPVDYARLILKIASAVRWRFFLQKAYAKLTNL